MALDFSKAHTFASEEQEELYTEQSTKQPNLIKKSKERNIGSSLNLNKAHTLRLVQYPPPVMIQ